MIHDSKQTEMPYPERLRNVRKSMAMIRVVEGERYRERVRARELGLIEQHEGSRAETGNQVSSEEVAAASGAQPAC